MHFDTVFVLMAVGFVGVWFLIGRIMATERT